MTQDAFIHDAALAADPIGDDQRAIDDGTKKNYAKVGSSRPSALLYTYGPGAIMDLPHFTVMPLGLDDWEPVWNRRPVVTTIHAPRLLEAVRTLVASSIDELRPFPWQAKPSTWSTQGVDLGVPARVFPQWLRCTSCDRLAPLGFFSYRNTQRFRPDAAVFEHVGCHGRPRRGGGRRRPSNQAAVPARYLLACADGHLDEFPYDWWVHEGGRCTKVDVPVLRMVERAGGKGANATIICESCSTKRPMSLAQGEIGMTRLPRCRGRHPHLDGFDPQCTAAARLMLVGASNLWFPALQSIIDMPRLDPAEKLRDDALRLRVALGADLAEFSDQLGVVRAMLRRSDGGQERELAELGDTALGALVELALRPPESEEKRLERRDAWDPIDLLVPEWNYLLREPARQFHADERSGLTLSPRDRGADLPERVSRVLAVDRLRKVNAVIGFTRIDELERVNDRTSRLVRLNRKDRPTWTVATEDRGEGIFLQLDEDAVSAWESTVLASEVWTLHRAAHRRNYRNRFSETAKDIDPDDRLRPPRYWLLHTLAHVLFREMALYSGYGAASLSERIYAWPAGGSRPPAAGVLICTTASDSDGTLGGLVRLSEPDVLARLMRDALNRARRCSSDPVCAMREPRDPEDFLHGAACHCCVMASETSCERANRFLDRRFLIALPGPSADLAFFG